MGVNSSLLAEVRGPVRTCIGCRQRSGKADLLRVVGSGLRVEADPAAVRPGRGAYLHRKLECFELAERRRAFSRALRIAGSVDLADVRATLATIDSPAVLVKGAQDEHPMNGQP